MPDMTASRCLTSRILVAAVAALGAATTSLSAQVGRRGHVLVANQQSANASLIDLATDSMRFIDVGVGPHEAVISPSGRGRRRDDLRDADAAGNELAIIDIKAGTRQAEDLARASTRARTARCSCRATRRASS